MAEIVWMRFRRVERSTMTTMIVRNMIPNEDHDRIRELDYL